MMSEAGDDFYSHLCRRGCCPSLLGPLLLLAPLQANVQIWLETIGLSQYKEDFEKAGYWGEIDVENLKRITEKQLRQEVHITKFGECHTSP